MSPANNPSVPDHVLPSSRYVSQPLRREAKLIKQIRNSFKLKIFCAGKFQETVFGSVKKTGKCIVTHEAPLTSGFGAELAAAIQVRSRVLFVEILITNIEFQLMGLPREDVMCLEYLFCFLLPTSSVLLHAFLGLAN